MLKRPLYIILNVFYFLVTAWCLLIADYCNEIIIPDYLKTGQLSDSMPTIFALIEGALLTGFFYAVNRLMLRYDYKLVNHKSIALRTAFISYGIILCIIIFGVIRSNIS